MIRCPPGVLVRFRGAVSVGCCEVCAEWAGPELRAGRERPDPVLTGEACAVHWTGPCPHQVTLARAVVWGGGPGAGVRKARRCSRRVKTALSRSLALTGGGGSLGSRPCQAPSGALCFPRSFAFSLAGLGGHTEEEATGGVGYGVLTLQF